MSTWNNDIEDYAKSRSKDPAKVEGILQRDGWEATKYTSSMKKALFEWLDQWYTLSIKNLPAPATAARRKNPTTVAFAESYKRTTKLPGGWTVMTFLAEDEFLTQVLNKGQQYAKTDRSKRDADLTHTQLVERILYDQSQSL
jgi:hypothetical protein